MKKPTGPQAPDHLAESTRKWFSGVVEEYTLEPHHERLLTLAAESWDRCTQAREAIAKDGITYIDRFGAPRAHPAVAVERDSRIAFARLLRELALDIATPESPRPQAIKR